MITLTELQKERFLSKIDKTSNDCWLWVGSKAWGGYGAINFNKKNYYAHRISYGLFKGEIPEKLHIDHLCRNRLCVNPNHLEAVTPRVNNLRGVGAAAQNSKKTHCPKGHAYSLENTYFFVNKPGRICKTCAKLTHASNERRYRLQRKILKTQAPLLKH